MTDELGAYDRPAQLGYTHLTVNHTDHFVDPVTGAKTQLIEVSWNRLRHQIVRTARHVSKENLPKGLAEGGEMGLCLFLMG